MLDDLWRFGGQWERVAGGGVGGRVDAGGVGLDMTENLVVVGGCDPFAGVVFTDVQVFDLRL